MVRKYVKPFKFSLHRTSSGLSGHKEQHSGENCIMKKLTKQYSGPKTKEEEMGQGIGYMWAKEKTIRGFCGET